MVNLLNAEECQSMIHASLNPDKHRSHKHNHGAHTHHYAAATPKNHVSSVHQYSIRTFPRGVLIPTDGAAENRSKEFVAVVCCISEDGSPRFYCVDAKCFHQGGNLAEGEVVSVSGDIEDLGNEGPNICLRCPEHKYLFCLATGDNVVQSPKFEGGRMVPSGCLKAVHAMQRVYHCRYDPSTGLTVEPISRRFASDAV